MTRARGPRLALALLAGAACVWPGADPATAGGAPSRVGCVDVSLLFIFHPAMRDYVFEENTFTPPAGPEVTTLDRKVALRQRHERLLRLGEQQSALGKLAADALLKADQQRSAALLELQKKQSQARATYDAQVSGGVLTREQAAAGLQQAMDRAEKEYWKVWEDTEKVKVDASRQYSAIEDVRTKASLLDPPALAHRVESMLAEIDQAVEQARTQAGLDLVFNDGVLPPPSVPRGKERLEWPAAPDDVVEEVNWYRQFIHPPPTAADPQRRKYFFAWYLRDLSDLIVHYRGSRLDRFIVSDTKDITAQALSALLTRHGVPAAKQIPVVRFVQALRGSAPGEE